MNYIQFSISNPVKIAVGGIMLVVAGLYALLAIPVQLTPNVDEARIRVETTWIGADPENIERRIIQEQESKLDSVNGLKKIIATAREGAAELELQFFVGTDVDVAYREVSNKLREVPDYPDNVDEPVITKLASSSETPIAWTVITSEDPWFNPASLADLVEDRILPELQQIDGVSDVRVYGGRKREVHVEVKPLAMAEKGVTYTELSTALRRQNRNFSAGTVNEGRIETRVRVMGEYEALDEVKSTIVKQTPGGLIRVSDVADVNLRLEKERSFVRSKGKPAIAIPIYRGIGVNVMSVMEEVRRRLDMIRDEGGILDTIAEDAQQQFKLQAVPELSYKQVYDETIYISEAVTVVQKNLVLGGLLAMIVLLCFLRNIRATIIIAVAIPMSVIGTFVVMTAAQRSINVVSLAGLAFAVGMVVDAAIVVLENIDRHLGMGKSAGQAALDGTKEVWGAILASTLTTVAVFLPVIFMQEEAGQLFGDIALAICASVLLSLVVSVTMIPSAGGKFLKAKKKIKRRESGDYGHFLYAFPNMIAFLSRPNFGLWLVRVVLILLITAASIGGIMTLMPKANYLPAGNRNLAFGLIFTPPAYTVDQKRENGFRVESITRPYFEAESYEDLKEQPPIYDYMGQPVGQVPPLENYFFVSMPMGLFTGAISADDDNVKPVASLLTSAINQVPGAFGFATQASIFSRGIEGNNSISVEVSGYDLDEIKMAAGMLRMGIGNLPGFDMRRIQPKPGNFDLPFPEVQVRAIQTNDKARNVGIDGTELGLITEVFVDGSLVGDFQFMGDAIDLRIVRDPLISLTRETLTNLPVSAFDQAGRRAIVTLNDVAEIRQAEAAQEIVRIDKQRAIQLTVTAPDDVPLQESIENIVKVEKQLKDEGKLPRRIRVETAGSADKLTQVRRSLIGHWQGWTEETLLSMTQARFVIALFVTYLLMAALFESFLYPLVIMFSVPLATVGGFAGLLAIQIYDPQSGVQFDIVTMLGFVILIGVVVNNAILIVHQALNFMRGIGESGTEKVERLSPVNAIRESVHSRIRPIFMTTMTSVCGMLPLVLAPGAGSELYRGLGSVVVGGLLVSTFFTLLVVPLLFSVLLDVMRLLGFSPVQQVD